VARAVFGQRLHVARGAHEQRALGVRLALGFQPCPFLGRRQCALFGQLALDGLQVLQRFRLQISPFSAIDSESPWVTIT